jgi:cysteine desulfurase
VIYFDHNATSPLREGVADAMARAQVALPGNPSSVHAAGRRARAAVEDAREQVAHFLGVLREEIVFTSGGTEGDNLAIRSLAQAAGARGRRHVITSPLEHPAVGGAVDALGEAGFAVTRLPVSARGELELDALTSALREDTALVSLALANHELGNAYPIAGLAQAAHARGALFHTDAVQAAGKRALDLGALGVDAATISAHKLGGPKAVGAVFVRRGLDLPPLLLGGHQERERRPGTENVAGIVGFGVACQLAAEAQVAEEARVLALRRRLERALLSVEGARLFGVGDAGDRLAGTTLVGFAGAPGQLVAIGLDLEGICVSTGAACTSGSLKPSPVLLAMGFDPVVASEGVRISLGWNNTEAEVERLAACIGTIVARVRGAAGPSLGVTAPASFSSGARA